MESSVKDRKETSYEGSAVRTKRKEVDGAGARRTGLDEDMFTTFAQLDESIFLRSGGNLIAVRRGEDYRCCESVKYVSESK